MAMRIERNKKVTPRMASAWLKKNAENNRRPKWARIAQYARDMIQGNWQSDTGEMIKFDDCGQLIDGQNRLQAVVMAEVPIVFDVAYDVPASAMAVIDSGVSRSAADAMKILGSTNGQSNLTSSIVRWVLLWDNEAPMVKGNSYNPTTMEINERYLSDRDSFDASVRRGHDASRQRVCIGSAAGTGHFLTSRVSRPEADAFFDSFLTGADVPRLSPILALRDRTQRAKIDRITRQELLALYIKAWNFYRADEPVNRLQLVRGELSNQNFPQPR